MEYANMNPFRLWFQLWVAFWQTPICPPPEDKTLFASHRCIDQVQFSSSGSNLRLSLSARAVSTNRFRSLGRRLHLALAFFPVRWGISCEGVGFGRRPSTGYESACIPFRGENQ